MSLEGKEEKQIGEFLYCAGIGANVERGTCERCDNYAGIRKEPISRIEHGEAKVIGLNEYVLCKYPKLEKIHKLFSIGE